MHLAAPLQVAGIDEGLAEAGGAAEVHRQHGIAAVRQPLVVRVEAVDVACPRAAVHQQHHRQGRFGLPFRVRRQGQIGDQLQPVAPADDGAPHRCQAIGLQIGTRGEELGDLARGSLVEMIGGRRLRRARNHDPAAVVVRPVGDADLAGQQAVQPLQVVGHALLERDPVEGEVLGADGLDRKRRGVSDEMTDVRLRVLGQHALLARLPIGGEQGRRVAAHRRDAVEGAAVAREADGVGRQIVLVLDDADRLELVAVDAVADAATFRRRGSWKRAAGAVGDRARCATALGGSRTAARARRCECRCGRGRARPCRGR